MNCKNGISSWELHRALGVTQKTAWFMLHRFRLAMQDDQSGGKLDGDIEMDESFIGGAARNMHKDRRIKAFQGSRGTTDGNKTIVVGVLQRKGKVRAAVVGDRKKKTLAPFVHGNVYTYR